MKNKSLTIIIMLSITVLLLSACAPQVETQPAAATEAQQPAPTQPAPATEAPAATEAMPQPTATAEMTQPEQPAVDVEALIKEKVAGNHDLDRIFNATKTRAEWEETLDRMIGYGAKINEEEKQLIIDYLLSR